MQFKGRPVRPKVRGTLYLKRVFHLSPADAVAATQEHAFTFKNGRVTEGPIGPAS